MGILDFFFPKRCLGCGRVGQYFCKECQSGLPLVENQICPECERPAIGGATHPGCKKHFGLDGLLSFFYFEGPIKDAIHKLKYRLIFDLAKELGDLVVDTRGNLKFLKTTNFTVVPVPLHPVRLKWRGFNQAEVLGQELANKLGCSFEGNLLQRIKNTRPQVELKG